MIRFKLCNSITVLQCQARQSCMATAPSRLVSQVTNAEGWSIAVFHVQCSLSRER